MHLLNILGILLLAQCACSVPQVEPSAQQKHVVHAAAPPRLRITPVADRKMHTSTLKAVPKKGPKRLASASPAAPQPSQPAQESRNAGKSFDYSAFQKGLFAPQSLFSLVPLEKRVILKSGDVESAAKLHVIGTTKGSMSNLKVVANLKSDHGVTHIHLIETFDGVPFANLFYKVNLDPQGRISSASIAQADLRKHPQAQNFTAGTKSISAIDAVAKVTLALGANMATSALKLSEDETTVTGAPFHKSDVRASPKMVYLPDGSFESVWELDVHVQLLKRFKIWVSTTDGRILGATNLIVSAGNAAPLTRQVSSAKNSTLPSPRTFSRRGGGGGGGGSNNFPNLKYRVVPFENANFGVAGTSLVTGNANGVASPNGWHNAILSTGSYVTSGNNVEVRNDSGFLTVSSGDTFDFPYVDASNGQKYYDAVNTNAFYMVNRVHDLFYTYGFTEPFGNFQVDNFGKGGFDNDCILVRNYWSTDNNVLPINYSLDSDGSSSNLYILRSAASNRHASMDNEALLLAISAISLYRLLDSPADWDTRGLYTLNGVSGPTSKAPTREPRTRATGAPNAIYSTNLQTNPITWADTDSSDDDTKVFSATVLYEVFWNMVDQAGLNSDIMAASSRNGNTAFLQILFDAFKLVSGSLQMIAVRDAMLQADEARYNRFFRCSIWRGFAKRGAGEGAPSDASANSVTVPSFCSNLYG
ncbi:hypothetical protein HDU97_010140 [Phlyctochytrium planicorne]|nr:hypothetical protein HDU97_010140 [Phlyctochytrium planicorne]